MADLEWFSSLSAVPGVDWRASVEVAVEPQWTAARPVVEELGDGESRFTLVHWVDERGETLPEETGFGSPAERATRGIREGGRTLDVLRAVTSALSLPGTRRDYYDAIERATSVLSRIDDQDPDRVLSIERFAWLGVALIRAGLEEAVVPPFTHGPDDRALYLGAAAMPYGTLVRLYQREGFLQEAAAVFAELQRLPAEARDRAYIEGDPRDVMAGLEELAGAEELAP